MNQARSSSGVGLVINLGLYIAAAIALCIVVNFYAQRSSLRGQFDATKTRAYSLTPSTRQLLSSVSGQWKIAVVLDEKHADRAMLKQIDEVLRRYTDASANFSIIRIDPTDPHTLGQYESLLADLRRLYQEPVSKYDQALDAGHAAFRGLLIFAQQQSGLLDPLLRTLAKNDPHLPQLEQLAQALGRLSDQGDVVLTEVSKARQSTDAQPIPDYETARSILAQGLSEYATQLNDMGQLLAKWSSQPDTADAIKKYAAASRNDYQLVSQHLAEAADPLKQLAPIDLSDIGKQLAAGEAAVILGPTRAAVIPSAQLFPKSNIQQRDNGAVTFDQRFRGEQLISSTIRSLTVPDMPLVVFVHAEDKSLLYRHDKDADLMGVASMLRASRYEIAEWMVGKQSEPPKPRSAKQRVVYVIIPPPPARSVDPTPATNALLEVIHRLINDGDSVLLSVAPSLLPKYGQRDPFAILSAAFGIHADTGRIVLESMPMERGPAQVVLAQALREFASDHLIGRAIDGQQAYFGLPIPLVVDSPQPTGVQQTVIASINGDATRWLETDWTGDIASRQPLAEAMIHEPVPVVIAAERSIPTRSELQRFMLVGSSGWMLTNVADRTQPIGGNRIAMENPGNHELMLASVAWLAGMDDLIAASPLSQETPRLRDLTPQARTTWFFLLVAGLPAVCIAMAVGVGIWRRR